VFDAWWIENAMRLKANPTNPLKIHLWVDVGMAREGLLPTDIERILPSLVHEGIVVEGVATHFNAVAQDHDMQKAHFEDVIRMLADNGIRPRIVHAIASRNGLGYSDLTGSISPGKAKLDALYGMVRLGAAIGLAPRWDLDGRQEEVLRIAIPIREARIAHIKEIPAGWNLGYWDNKFRTRNRIAVLEGTRLNTLRYETFQRGFGEAAATLKPWLSHGSVATIELSTGECNVGDVLTCSTDMWLNFLTRGFARKEDGSCLVAVKDALSEKTIVARIAVRELPNDHLAHKIEQFVALLLNHHLEFANRPKRVAWFVKDMVTRAMYHFLLLANRIPPLGERVRSMLAPISVV
jgi:hypothetical protein